MYNRFLTRTPSARLTYRGDGLRGFMRHSLGLLALTFSAVALAQTPAARRAVKDTELKKKVLEKGPDSSLAGDVTRTKATTEQGPTFTYDQYRADIELQLAEKRREQIRDLQKIIDLSDDKVEKPNLLFRLGELYWEESRFYFIEANRQDDVRIAAIKAGNKAGIQAAEEAKDRLSETQRNYAGQAVQQYLRIVQNYPKYERTDEVLYFLGLNLGEMGDDRRSVAAFKRLTDNYKNSKYLPDAYLALGEFYFNNSKGNRQDLLQALGYYQSATKFSESPVYGYALYKQGWCYFNLNDFEKAMDQFKAVVLFAEFAGVEEVEGKKGSKGNRTGLAREARNDYVRTYSRTEGGPAEAKERFAKLSKQPDDLRTMMKQLANLYYDDGKDRDAAVTYQGLIAEKPLSVEAPGFQARIVDSVMRAGKKEATVAQVRRLVKIVDEVRRANPKPSPADQKLLDEAGGLAERTISRLAVDWHNEAKKTRDDQTFKDADSVYADYLTLFPTNPKAYDLRYFYASLLSDNLNDFDRAATQYDLVAKQDTARIAKNEKPGKWLEDAAFNSILAWTEVGKRANLKQPQSDDPTTKIPIPRERQGFLDACNTYIKYVPKGAKRVEIMYKAARVYYEYNYFDEAVALYSEIALKNSTYRSEDNSNLAEISAQTIVDTFNFQGDWQKVNEWATRFFNEPKLGSASFKEDMRGFVEQSSFKLITQLEAKKEYRKAADTYMAFVKDWPNSTLADKALYNAAIDYFNGRALDRAIEVRKQLVSKHPNSPYVPGTLYALAEGYEATAEFALAADFYELYAQNYQKSTGSAPVAKKGAKAKAGRKKAATSSDKLPALGEQVWDENKAHDGLLNAAIFREALGQFKQSLADRALYIALWPSRPETETVEKSVISLQEKMGNWKQAIQSLDEYQKKYVRDQSKVLGALGRTATIYDEHLKNTRMTKATYKAITDYYDKMGKRAREGLDKPALDAMGRAAFADLEPQWTYYKSLKLKWSRLNNIDELKATIKTKSESLNKIKDEYTKVVAFKSAGPAICSLDRMGLAYDDFAEKLSNFPVPKGLPEDVLYELKPQFEQQAEPAKSAATELFTTAVQRSQDLDTFNACTANSLDMLRKKYAPNKYLPVVEDVPPTPADKALPSRTYKPDFIVALQEAPVESGSPPGPATTTAQLKAPAPTNAAIARPAKGTK